ncbi:hypothetical protein E2C01_083572 [Portunus trituberculatus]|uniref:Uncharacterized protein n=1 Tax=Portunus trituberculatus TaxID=210409 RepID=A0A5B7J592_PORTR|nr:hypothetical protein [Portunus trituberculatus]
MHSALPYIEGRVHRRLSWRYSRGASKLKEREAGRHDVSRLSELCPHMTADTAVHIAATLVWGSSSRHTLRRIDTHSHRPPFTVSPRLFDDRAAEPRLRASAAASTTHIYNFAALKPTSRRHIYGRNMYVLIGCRVLLLFPDVEVSVVRGNPRPPMDPGRG